ncbi:MAG: hypothetical protein P8Y14_19865 [Anaerolineales bacterium]
METEDFLIALAQHMPTIAIEVSKENSFGMILLPQPQVQYTSAETIYPDQPGSAPARPYTPLPEILLPEIALGIADCQYGAPVASIGMFTTHREGHIGFTTALHATKRKSTMVFVDDILPCVVIEEIPVLDACFAVVLDYESEAFSNYVLSKASVATTSPLSKRTPSIGETGTFKGTSSSTKMTEVCGWDWELPHGVNPNSQLKVYGIHSPRYNSRRLGSSFDKRSERCYPRIRLIPLNKHDGVLRLDVGRISFHGISNSLGPEELGTARTGKSRKRTGRGGTARACKGRKRTGGQCKISGICLCHRRQIIIKGKSQPCRREIKIAVENIPG